MVAWIHACRPQGSVRNSVTVVFDGKEDVGVGASAGPNRGGRWGPPVHGIEILFSHGQSADDLIKKIIEQSSEKKTWIVVSDDKDIKLYVRGLGAQVQSVKEFIKVGAEHARPLQGSGHARCGKYISLTDQARINRELERIWLKST